MENEVFALEFVHLPSIGNEIESDRIMDVGANKIEELYQDKIVEGFRLLLMTSAQTVEDKLVYINYDIITNGKFPFVYLVVQPTSLKFIPTIDSMLDGLG